MKYRCVSYFLITVLTYANKGNSMEEGLIWLTLVKNMEKYLSTDDRCLSLPNIYDMVKKSNKKFRTAECFSVSFSWVVGGEAAHSF